MVKVEYYTKDNKTYHYEPTEAEASELARLRTKSLWARRYEEKRQAEQHKLEHSKGYCPCCFMLKPLTGICPNCN